MAGQRRLGDVLSDRRRSLGVSLERVTYDTKLQRRTIEAFERTDAASLPDNGYTRANLTTYARYLGLDPQDVVRLYEQERAEGATHATRRQTPRSYATSDRRSDETRERGGREGAARSRSQERYDAWMAQDRRAGTRREGDVRTERGTRLGQLYDIPGRETTRDGSARERGVTSSRRAPSYGEPAWRDVDARMTHERDRERVAARAASRQATRGASGRTGSDRAPDVRQGSSRTARGGARVDASGRVNAGSVSDMMSRDTGYQGGSGGSRNGYGNPSRSSSERVNRANEIASSLRGLTGFITGFQSFFRENRLMVGGMLAIIAILLVIILVFAVGSCVRGASEKSGPTTIPVTQVGAESASSADTAASSSPATTQQATTAATATVAPAATQQQTPTIDVNALPAGSTFTFTVDATSTTSPWVEVSVDGLAKYAAQAAPGESETFEMGGTATISLSDARFVTITVDGVQVQPTINEAGMATVTLTSAVTEPEVATEGDVGVAGEGAEAAPAEEEVPAA